MALFGKKEQARLKVTGMTCDNCRRHVEDALKGVAGVASVKVDLMFHKADVAYDPAKTSVSELLSAVDAAGYKAEPKEA